MAQDELLTELMREYALCGVRDWPNVGDELRRRARKCLENRIIDTVQECRHQVSRPAQDRFFPMPRKPEARRLELCFFRMRKDASFELFVVVDLENCLGFRFEPADGEFSRHNYPHVQFCRRLLTRDLRPAGVPDWLPDSYPAFPLPYSDPTRLFLAMLTSIHGRAGGLDELLKEIFQQASKITQWRKYTAILDHMLNGKLAS